MSFHVDSYREGIFVLGKVILSSFLYARGRWMEPLSGKRGKGKASQNGPL